jgi:uncharacterized membrane protein YqjE
MGGEAKMNTNGRIKTDIPDVAGSFSDLTHDVIELTELQSKLLVLDIKKSSQRLQSCAILAVIGVCLLLGTFPVALLALSQVFVQQFAWSQAAALGAATLLGLLLTAAAAGAAWSIFQSGVISLNRSREEFSRNVDWLKSTLKNRGQSTADHPTFRR